MKTLEHLTTLDENEQNRLRDDSIAQGFPQAAFDLTSEVPENIAFSAMNILFEFNMDPAIYQSKLESCKKAGAYGTAVDLLSQLGVESNEYTYGLVIPAVLTVPQSKVELMTRYFKEQWTVPNEVLNFLVKATYSLKECRDVAKEYEWIVCEDAWKPENTQKKIAWLQSRFMSFGSLFNNFKDVHHLTSLRMRMMVEGKVFFQKMKHMLRDNVRLQHFVISNLISSRSFEDVMSLVKHFQFDSNLLSTGARQLLEDFLKEGLCFKGNSKLPRELPSMQYRVDQEIDLVTTESEFVTMLNALRNAGDGLFVALACRETDDELNLLQITYGARIYVIDVQVGLFPTNLWQSLVEWLGRAVLLLGNTKSGDILKAHQFRGLDFPKPLEILNMVDFFEHLKTIRGYKLSIRPSPKIPVKACVMQHVVKRVLGKNFDQIPGVWTERPLLPETLKYAGLMVYCIYECFTKIQSINQKNLVGCAKGYLKMVQRANDFTIEPDV